MKARRASAYEYIVNLFSSLFIVSQAIFIDCALLLIDNQSITKD
ncbi:MAG: hypothetical protein ACFCAD_15330 [Pleurocapsa sp.]